MTNRFLISVAAAALIAGTGFANAQGTGMSREGGAGQQTAPSSERGAPSAAPMNRDSSAPAGAKDAQPGETKGAQSDQKSSPGAVKNQRAQDEMKPGTKGEKSAQDNLKGEKKGMSAETNDGAKGAKDGGKGMNAETKGGMDSRSQTTTGQAAAGAKLSTEQRTQISTVIREQRVQPVNNVNFSISVGTRVPREGVTFHPLPPRIVSIYPDWRGYEFILVRDQIVVINPRTLEIVAVLEA